MNMWEKFKLYSALCTNRDNYKGKLSGFVLGGNVSGFFDECVWDACIPDGGMPGISGLLLKSSVEIDCRSRDPADVAALIILCDGFTGVNWGTGVINFVSNQCCKSKR